MCEARLAAGRERITISVVRFNEKKVSKNRRLNERERVVLPVRIRLNWSVKQD